MASLSFSSAKYDSRAGRAELLAELISKKHTFKTVKDGSEVVFKSIQINGKLYSITDTATIATALKSNSTIVLISESGAQLSLSALEKSSAFKSTKSGFNAGDVAEGVFAIALAARFMNKDSGVTYDDLKAVQKTITRKADMSSGATLSSPNANPKIVDTVNLTINLAKINLDALLRADIFEMLKDVTDASIDFVNQPHVKKSSNLLYMNNQLNTINIISDGIGNQTGTKMDVRVEVSDKNGVMKEFELNVSLKAGDVKQFGQVGGGGFDKQQKLFEVFGVKLGNTEEEKFNSLQLVSIYDALKYSYQEAVKKFNMLRTKEDILKTAITKYMIGDEDIILVQLNKKSHTYDPRKLNFTKITAKLKEDGKLPKIQFYDHDDHVLDIRIKVENGSYVRNYVEKGGKLHDKQVIG